MEKKDKLWNSEYMEKFLEDFDPVGHKYMRYVDKDKYDPDRREELYRTLAESCRCEERWTLDEIEDVYQTVEKVYGEKENYFCKVIKLTTEKFLGSYVGIEGIGQLFKASYFYFEWMMHLEYSKNVHDYTYYRDHYVHQVRNMFEMFRFLDAMEYEEKCRNMYQEMDNNVAKFLRKSVKEEMAGTSGRECAYALEESLYGYLFYASSIIASLLHDIGYPVNYIGRTVKELGSFLPFSHIFVQEVETISTIHAVLQDSLLYKVMKPEAVAKHVEGKDHGALSAVILLYKYYDNGKMALLSPIKRAAIELAALMIYNHTLGYRNQGKEESIYYKNIFRENPMSFLFRLCDDLQEWDRVYFEVSKKSSFFVCEDCLMPSTRHIEDSEARDTGKTNKTTPRMLQKQYSCWCGPRRGWNTTTFAYRRLVNIIACTELECERNENRQIIRIRYNKGRLMQIAAYSPSFAVKRAEGVWEIKQMLDSQRDFPKTFVDFCVSNNPILLKAEIMKEWFDGKGCEAAALEQEYNAVLSGKSPVEQLEILKRIVIDMGSKSCRYRSAWDRDKILLRNAITKENPKWSKRISSIKYIWEKAYFYYCLSFLGSLLQKLDKKVAGQWIYSKKGDELQLLCKVLQGSFSITDRVEKLLAEDFIRQKLCQYDERQFWNIGTDQEKQLYLDSFLLGKFYTDVVRSYVREKKYGEIKEGAWRLKGKEPLPVSGYDYYTDYYFYFTISEITDSE